MSDKELMMLAAKAGLPDGFEWNSCKGSTGGYAGVIEYIPKGSVYYKTWSPLTDDGDALRLAVALNLDILQSADGKVEVTNQFQCDEDVRWAWESHASDPLSATRRAIVRTAAEIGRTMP